MKILIFILPGLYFFKKRKVIKAIVCLILQLSIIGWIPAIIIAFRNEYPSKKPKFKQKNPIKTKNKTTKKTSDDKVDFKDKKEQLTKSKDTPTNLKPEIQEVKLKEVVYCKNCGANSNNVANLVKNKCDKGKHRTKLHVPYSGSIKKEYDCKHCGRKFPSIRAMINTNSCKSSDKKHEPLEN
jgi:DNA-directed RNA polymerase subunit RPC12/RpoP/uncharacterized membrane protein YqaE (UPF0057 family)